MNHLNNTRNYFHFSPTFVDQLVDQCTSRLDQWRTNLAKLDRGSLKDISETSFLGKELRSAAIIAAMAELEHFLRELLVNLCDEITAASLPVNQLIPTLRPLAVYSAFESLSSSKDAEKIWPQRLAVTALENSADVAKLPTRQIRGPQPPLDGKTITPAHIARVQAIFSLPLFSLPSAPESASLLKLSGLRNDLAHRNIPVADLFSSKGVRCEDIDVHLDNIGTLIVRLGLAWIAYLEGGLYKSSA